jgi:hypothetical protein
VPSSWVVYVCLIVLSWCNRANAGWVHVDEGLALLAFRRLAEMGPVVAKLEVRMVG